MAQVIPLLDCRRRWPKLYKKTTTGAIQEWLISVLPFNDGTAVITTEFGQIDGAKQTAEDVVREGKNIGKKNETTPAEQACKEAQSKWEKQQKNKGYVGSIEAAQAEEINEDLVVGGIYPMLAQKYRDHAKKIYYPAAGQPKLDGIRCIAHVKNGKCRLWSRTRKEIHAVPHVAREIERLFPKGEWFLDGELYNHALKADFERLVSLVRRDEPSPECEVMQYHMYDIAFPGETFRKRNLAIIMALDVFEGPIVKYVETVNLQSEDDMLCYFAEKLEEGFEGCMVRNWDGLYFGHPTKRSNDLQKVKEMTDEEYPIVGVEAGRGKMAECAIFVCQTKDGKRFNCKMKGSLDNLERYLKDRKLWEGKQLTVRYQNLSADGIPRFPVGIAVRDYE